MTRHRHATRRVNPTASRLPKPLTDGKVRCNGCGAVVGLTKTGRIRAHKTPDSREDCAYTVTYGQPVELDETPPVVLTPGRQPKRSTPHRPEGQPSRLDVGSSCVECGKWIPGERSLCGACYAKRPTGGRSK